jgi:hypothetical protein
MEQISSWEVDTRSAGEEFPAIMKPVSSIPCSQEPVSGYYPVPDESLYALKPHFFNIHFNILFLSTCMTHKWSLPWIFRLIMYVLFSAHISVTWSTHVSLLQLIKVVISGEEKKLLNSSLCRFLHPPSIFLRLRTKLILSIPFSDTVNLYSSSGTEFTCSK